MNKPESVVEAMAAMEALAANKDAETLRNAIAEIRRLEGENAELENANEWMRHLYRRAVEDSMWFQRRFRHCKKAVGEMRDLISRKAQKGGIAAGTIVRLLSIATEALKGEAEPSGGKTS